MVEKSTEYRITLTEDQFKELQEIVHNDFLASDSVNSTTSEIYKLFKWAE